MIDHAFNIVTAGSVFFAVSIGLLVVLSVMRVVNLAHGAFLTIGGYAAVVVSDHGWNPWLSLLLAPAAGFVLGLLTELVLVRRLYGRPLDTILATWGLAIVITQVISDRFGRSAHFVEEAISGDPLQLFGAYYSPYRLFTVGIAVALGVLERTGAHARIRSALREQGAVAYDALERAAHAAPESREAHDLLAALLGFVLAAADEEGEP